MIQRTRLSRVDLGGWKSIRCLSGFEWRPINVMIGANGAGKSNLISFFRFLEWMTRSPGELQYFVGKHGGASTLLHESAQVTPELAATLVFENDQGQHEYAIRLAHAARDTLVFVEERFRLSWSALPGSAEWVSLDVGRQEREIVRVAELPASAEWVSFDVGHQEAEIVRAAEQGVSAARPILRMLRGCGVYQFHDTSDTARVRQRWQVEDNRILKEDAANLAPFLHRLRQANPKQYARIVETIRQIAPFFADFELAPWMGTMLLQWRERGTDVVFGPHQASDGTLRMMALVALLLQPEEDLPQVVILDEPELGLHPYAINIVAGLIRSISTHAQVIVATQSMTLVDYFQPDEIVVVDRAGRESNFRRLDADRLTDWLEEYSIAELWEKNVIGGRPAA
jgi:predicted ATPase